jgi:AmmeMemoRadiSam system protein B/AmmeMemoRadiSam system protein A
MSGKEIASIVVTPSREYGDSTEDRMRLKIIAAPVLTTLLVMLVLASACLGLPASQEPTVAITSTPSPPAPHVEPDKIRAPAVAGAFYPEDAEELAAMVDTFLEAVEDVDGEPIAVIAPHAGYVYSGWVAAYAFKELQGVAYDTIVIIGPNHRHPTFQDISVYAEGAFQTPLGYIPVDEEVAQALVDANERIVFDPEVHTAEHSIEVELPFLQRIYEDFEIVPIIIGQPTEENIESLTEALVQVLADRKALIIASSDMSHYPSYEDAIRVDTATLAAIETMNSQTVLATTIDSITKGVPNLSTCLCGQGPVLTAVKAAHQLGANQVTILQYANSGDSPFVAPDRSRVVGYGAVMFWHYEPPDLSVGEKAKLLTIARESIARYLEEGTLPQFTFTEPNLLRKSGAFVTLEQKGELRGCIGHILAQQPLYTTVQQAAVSAATEDTRFAPLTTEELEETSIEISVLSPLKRVTDVEEIDVGRHGLIIVAEGTSGLLLPQVASEEGWDRQEFLEAVCRKAGLPEDAWQKGAALYTFTAIVFGEGE